MQTKVKGSLFADVACLVLAAVIFAVGIGVVHALNRFQPPEIMNKLTGIIGAVT